VLVELAGPKGSGLGYSGRRLPPAQVAVGRLRGQDPSCYEDRWGGAAGLG
jgi:hypothetical protein